LSSVSPEGSLPDISFQVIDAVRRRFPVASEYHLENGNFEFNLESNVPETKQAFKSLLDEVGKYHKTAVLRKQADGSLQLHVLEKMPYSKQRVKIPLVLLLATIIAVFADGYLRSSGYSDPLTSHLSASSVLMFASIYVVALLGILGTHEMGHKIASWVHKMKSSWPYFIPGIPGIIPTFGAVIRAGDIPPNRDALFDLGLSGPIAGLVVTFFVSIFAAISAQLIPASSYPTGTAFTSFDYYTSFLMGLIRPGSSTMISGGALFQLLYFAYSLGFFVTFINLLPAWQLDGGHIANSAVSPKVHQILTFVSIIILIVTGLYLMGFLILFMWSRAPGLRPLDDVSPLSNSRKVLFILTWVLAAAIGGFVILSNPIFGLSPFRL
jgi:membrane-associated protease RseP (regulator of RpoE activity)